MFNTMRDLPYRILVMLVNIFFPPLAVMMLTGLGADTAMNCLLFLLAVIPSHVHGFYLSWMYFWRRRKVRKGKYPGPPLSLIASKDVSNGGLSDKEVARLYRGEKGLERKVSGRSRRSKSKSRSRSRSRSASRSLSGSRAWEAHAAHRQQGGLLHARGGRGLGARAGADEFLGRQGSKRVGRSRAGSQRSAVSSAGGGRERDFERERRWAAQVAQDGYGPVLIQDGGIGSPASSGVGRVARH